MDQKLYSKDVVLFRISLVPEEDFEILTPLQDRRDFFEQPCNLSIKYKDGSRQGVPVLPFIRIPGKITMIANGEHIKARMVKSDNQGQFVCTQEVTQNGTVHLVFENFHREIRSIWAEWIIPCLLLSMECARAVKKESGCPDCMYRIDIECEFHSDKKSPLNRFRMFLFKPDGFKITPHICIKSDVLKLTGFKMRARDVFHHVIQNVINGLYQSGGFKKPDHFSICIL